MTSRSWFRSRRRSTTSRLSRPRLQVESLEARCVPAFMTAPGSPVAVGNVPLLAVAAELTGDSQVDAAVTNLNDNTVSILRNDGTGRLTSLGAAVPLPAGSGPEGIAAGRLRSGGPLDLVTANTNGTVSVLRNNGAGSFTPTTFPVTPVPAPANPLSLDYIALADFRAAGRLDVAVADFNNNVVYLLQSRADGTLVPTPVATLGAEVLFHPEQLVLEDYDGDGRTDLAVANQAAAGFESTVVVFPNRSDNVEYRFGEPVVVRLGIGRGATGLAAGLLDGDGRPDLAVANFGFDRGGSVSVLRNASTLGAISFTVDASVDVGRHLVNVTVSDHDGDRRADLAVTSTGDEAGADNRVLTLRNTTPVGAPITLAAAEVVTVGSNPSGLVTADFEGDASPDLLVTHAGAGTVSVLLNPRPVAPVEATIRIEADRVLRPVSDLVFGANVNVYDANLNSPETRQLASAAGLRLIHLTNGAAPDADLHFDDQPLFDGAGTAGSLANFAASIGATTVVTVNYGGGSPQEAAAYLAYLNSATNASTAFGPAPRWNGQQYVTRDWRNAGFWAGVRASAPVAGNADGLNHLRLGRSQAFGVRYVEIGSEIYFGNTPDHHDQYPGQPEARAHDPATYIRFAREFAALARQVDPTIRIGIGVAPPDLNLGWNEGVLREAALQGFVPDFLSDHNYVYDTGSESDELLLQHQTTRPDGTRVTLDRTRYDWGARDAAFRELVRTHLPNEANRVELLATEFNSAATFDGANLSKQSTSLVNGLFVADALGGLLQSSYTGAAIWQLRSTFYTDPAPGSPNGQADNPNLYGWRRGGDYGLLGAVNVGGNFRFNGVAPFTGPNIAYPTYFAEQLVAQAAQAGGSVVQATSSSPLVSAYAFRRNDDHLALLVINKSPTQAQEENVTVTGFTPSGETTIWQYGQDQDNAQRDSADGAASLLRRTTTFTVTPGNGSSMFRFTVPAYSMSVFDLAPAVITPPPPATVPTITSITPDHGPVTGGTTVTLTGTNFTGAFQVRIGDNLAAVFDVESPTRLTVVVPTSVTPGGVPVSVRTATGISGAVTFTYDAVAPQLTPSQRFVDRAYRDLLGRPADASGLAYFSGLLDRGVTDRLQVALALTATDEYRQHEINALYQSILDRDADAGGIGFFTSFLARGGTTEVVRAVLHGTEEYRVRVGGTDTAFVQQLYRDVIGREVDASGLGFWLGQLRAGTPAALVASALISSSEGRQVRVNALFQRYLRRDADRQTQAFIADLFSRGVTEEVLVAVLVGSEEYAVG